MLTFFLIRLPLHSQAVNKTVVCKLVLYILIIKKLSEIIGTLAKGRFKRSGELTIQASKTHFVNSIQSSCSEN